MQMTKTEDVECTALYSKQNISIPIFIVLKLLKNKNRTGNLDFLRYFGVSHSINGVIGDYSILLESQPWIQEMF